jgi:hypothetical protein
LGIITIVKIIKQFILLVALLTTVTPIYKKKQRGTNIFPVAEMYRITRGILKFGFPGLEIHETLKMFCAKKKQVLIMTSFRSIKVSLHKIKS